MLNRRVGTILCAIESGFYPIPMIKNLLLACLATSLLGALSGCASDKPQTTTTSTTTEEQTTVRPVSPSTTTTTEQTTVHPVGQ